MELQILEVSQVNAYIKGLFDRDALLGQVCVHGELSNYKVYPSGHHYFTLKDAEADTVPSNGTTLPICTTI